MIWRSLFDDSAVSLFRGNITLEEIGVFCVFPVYFPFLF